MLKVEKKKQIIAKGTERIWGKGQATRGRKEGRREQQIMGSEVAGVLL